MRVFAAIAPPEPVIEHLDEFWEPRRSSAPFRSTDPAQWHITLAFAEDVPEYRLDDLTDRLGEATDRRGPFDVRLAGGGTFPHVLEAKVLFAGVAAVEDGASEELERLSTGARHAFSVAGAHPDGRRFSPHVTLGRTRPTNLVKWVSLLDGYTGPTWTVDEVVLFSSHLGEGPRGRPRYEVEAVCSLGRAARVRP